MIPGEITLVPGMLYIVQLKYFANATWPDQINGGSTAHQILSYGYTWSARLRKAGHHVYT